MDGTSIKGQLRSDIEDRFIPTVARDGVSAWNRGGLRHWLVLGHSHGLDGLVGDCLGGVVVDSLASLRRMALLGTWEGGSEAEKGNGGSDDLHIDDSGGY